MLCITILQTPDVESFILVNGLMVGQITKHEHGPILLRLMLLVSRLIVDRLVKTTTGSISRLALSSIPLVQDRMILMVRGAG